MNGIQLAIEIYHVQRHGGTAAAIEAEGFCYDYVYLVAPGLGDVRNNPGAAADMLAYLIREQVKGSEKTFFSLDHWRALAFSPDAASATVRNIVLEFLMQAAAPAKKKVEADASQS